MDPCFRTSACTHLLESSQGLGATTQRNDSFSPGRTREMRSSSRNQVFDLESDFRLEKMCACPSAKAGTHTADSIDQGTLADVFRITEPCGYGFPLSRERRWRDNFVSRRTSFKLHAPALLEPDRGQVLEPVL